MTISKKSSSWFMTQAHNVGKYIDITDKIRYYGGTTRQHTKLSSILLSSVSAHINICTNIRRLKPKSLVLCRQIHIFQISFGTI